MTPVPAPPGGPDRPAGPDGPPISRRALLRGAVALGVVAVVGACGDDEPSAAPAGQGAADTTADTSTSGTTPTTPTTAGGTGATPSTTLAPTPACDDGDDPTPAQTEGPYFTPNSPERASLLEGVSGTRLVLTGKVLDAACRPVPRALLDFWQADDAGQYDNRGFRLRGHVFTDGEGRYRLETVVPGIYTGRTRHIHVKVQAPKGPVLTTQLYFPDEPANARDGIFRRELLMQVTAEGAGRTGRFDFVVRT